MTSSIGTLILSSSMLLDVHPHELRFRFEPNKLIACSLDLTNNTDKKVAFGLLKRSDRQMCLLRSLPLFGIVNPGTIYTIVLIMDKYKNLPMERNVDLILQSTTDYGIFRQGDSVERFYLRNVKELALKGVCGLQGETIFEIISMEDNHAVHGYGICSMDANQIQPLIITGHSDGFINIWNYETQTSYCSLSQQLKSMGLIRIPEQVKACSVKFVARKGLFLVGTNDGFIHVYNYEKKSQKIMSIKAHSICSSVYSLAIHPTKSYVLSASGSGRIKLWDCVHGWFGWKCIQAFKEHSQCINAVTFNPEDCNSFASASNDGTIKIWSLDSPKSKHTLYGDSGWLTCLEFFTRDGQQYLITGSYGRTAKIWDLEKKECIHILPHRFEVLSVLPHPRLPLLVTSTLGGGVYFWSSTNFRLKRMLNIGGLGGAEGLACLMESGRVVVAHRRLLSVIEIRDEVEQVASMGNSRSSISGTV